VSRPSRACRLFITWHEQQTNLYVAARSCFPTLLFDCYLQCQPVRPMCACVFVPARYLHQLVCNSPSVHVHTDVHASHRSTLLPGGGSFTCLCNMGHCVTAVASLPSVPQIVSAKQDVLCCFTIMLGHVAFRLLPAVLACHADVRICVRSCTSSTPTCLQVHVHHEL
jgi:hypothetical protein